MLNIGANFLFWLCLVMVLSCILSQGRIQAVMSRGPILEIFV